MILGCDKQSQHASPTASVSIESVSWSSIEADQLSDEAMLQLDRASDARQEMEAMLKSKLMGAIQEGGPSNAVNVCSTIAPAIAQDMSTKHGLAIGRTSSKLRNTNNTAPSWLNTTIESQASTAMTFTGSNGSLAVGYPITIAPPCMLCHGDPESLNADVLSNINNHYPDDQATGYQLGDLRGWFWVEVGPSD